MKKEVILVLAIILCSGFLSAAYDVTPSSFSSEIYTSTQYNITINNTDSGNNNITQVNVTLPGNLTFFSGTNGTSSESSFSNTSSVISWTNSTYIITSSKFSSSLESFWFNANSTGLGNYNLTVKILNSSGSSVTKNISLTISDTTNPSINFVDPTPSDSSSISQNFIPVNITASDNFMMDTIIAFIYDNDSMLENSTSFTSSALFNFTSLNDGTYYINATVNDTSGNEASTSTREITIDTVNETSGTAETNETCIPNWGCSNWSECVGGTQVRTCSDTNLCGDSSTKPEEERECNGECTPNWECTDWSPESCSEGDSQTRTCNDINSCGDQSSKPSEERLCPESSGSFVLYSIVAGIMLMIIIGIVTVIYLIKGKVSEEPKDDGKKFLPKSPLPKKRPKGKMLRRIPRLPMKKGQMPRRNASSKRFPPRFRR